MCLSFFLFFGGKGGGGRVLANLLIREPPIWEGRRMAGSLFRQTPLNRTSIVTKVKVLTKVTQPLDRVSQWILHLGEHRQTEPGFSCGSFSEAAVDANDVLAGMPGQNKKSGSRAQTPRFWLIGPKRLR